jgi:hypothetical protein
MNVQGQPPESGLHIKVRKHFAACHRVPENKIEVDVDEWSFALTGERCPHEEGVGRPLTLFDPRTAKECTVKGS